MSCVGLVELIPVEIAGLLEGEEWARLGAHLAECAGCRAERERLVTLLAQVPEALGGVPGEAWEELAAALSTERIGRAVAAAATSGPAPERWRGSPTPSAPAAAPLRRLGSFELLGSIGQGGLCELHRARHVDTGQLALIRVVPHDSQERLRERLRREAAALARLDHPGVVRLLGSGEEQGIHWSALEWVEGEDLATKVQRFGRCTPAEAGAIVLSLAEALAAAHSLGILHREVSPERVVVDAAGRVKLGDFGLTALDRTLEPLTCEGAFVGSPGWMAPEVGRVSQLDGRLDVYSLGLTFYYLLTGVPPLREFSSLEILSAKAHERIRSPRAHVPELPEGHLGVLARMLAKDREQRYASCEELIDDLMALLEGRAPRADQPGPWGPQLPGRAPTRWRTSARARRPVPVEPLPFPRLGPFELLDELGRGGLGIVYRGRHVESGQLVALKVMYLAHLDGSGPRARTLERFRREVEAVSRVAHEGVIRVLGSGQGQDHVWLALELVEGETLAEKQRAFGRCTPAEAGEIVLALAQALAATHAAGLVHRDLKPAEVLIDGEGRVKLSGLANPRQTDELCLSRTGCMLGTPYYMAPELLRGERDVDGRADLFSLGVVFYELLTGRLPHGRPNTTMELCQRVREGKLDPPTLHVPTLPEGHQRVLARLLAIDPARRYASAEELVRDLEALREGRAPQAPPVTAWWRRWLGL